MSNPTDMLVTELGKVIPPSIDICNAALSLAVNRCDDLEIQPIICFLFIRELAALNAREYVKQKQSQLDKVLAMMPEELKKELPNEGVIDLHRHVEELVVAYINDHMKLAEVRAGR